MWKLPQVVTALQRPSQAIKEILFHAISWIFTEVPSIVVMGIKFSIDSAERWKTASRSTTDFIPESLKSPSVVFYGHTSSYTTFNSTWSTWDVVRGDLAGCAGILRCQAKRAPTPPKVRGVRLGIDLERCAHSCRSLN